MRIEKILFSEQFIALSLRAITVVAFIGFIISIIDIILTLNSF